MTGVDTASHGTPQLDNGELRHTLTVHEVEAALVAAAVPRSRRQIIRYCETGLLEAVKVPGPTGAQWYVSPASLPKAIGDLKQWEVQRAGQSSTALDMSSSVTPEKPLKTNSDTASHGAPKPAMSISDKGESTKTELDMSRYVTLLERDNEFLRDQVEKKDDQIQDLSQRFSETQTLLGAMQRMIAPLLGQADPFKAPASREDASTRTSS